MLPRPIVHAALLILVFLNPAIAQCNRFSISFIKPAPGFTVFVGQTYDIQMQVNDCASKQPFTSGSVVVDFSNKDPQLALEQKGNGLWHGSWTPAHAVDGETDLTVFAASSAGVDGNQFAGTVSPPAAPFTVDRSNLVFQTIAGSAAASQTFHVFNNGSTAQGVGVATVGGILSISVSPASATIAPGDSLTVTVVADPRNISPGVVSDAVKVSGSSGSVTVLVNISVAAPAASPQLTLDASSVSLSLTQGDSPATRSLNLTNSTSTAVSFQALVSDSWLVVSPSDSVPAGSSVPLSISFTPGSLSPGPHFGQVTVSTPFGQFLQIQVTLTILPRPVVIPRLSVDTDNVSLAAITGVAALPQTIRLSNPNAVAVDFTIASSVPWLSGAPLNGTVTANGTLPLQIAANALGLDPGSYSGVITLKLAAPPGTADSDIPVVPIAATLDVVAPSNTTCASTRLLILITNPASGASLSIGQPTTIGAQLADDCGNRPTTAAVTAAFSNGDRTLSLIHVSDGRYTATWVPTSGLGATRITISALLLAGASVSAAQATLPVNLLASSVPPQIDRITNAASFAANGVVSPGELVVIIGDHLANCTQSTDSGPYPVQFCAAQVLIGGLPAPLSYVSPTQINLQVPYDLPVNTQQQLNLLRSDTISSPIPVTIADAHPGIFTLSQTGTGTGLIFSLDFRMADSTHPLAAGDLAIIFCTGLGAVVPAVLAGVPASPAASSTANPVALTIGGRAASVVSAGLAPGFIGTYQVKMIVPSGVTPGSAVPVVLRVAGQDSPAVTMALR
jgi:uncharacterized protein (TIGR03437 family)